MFVVCSYASKSDGYIFACIMFKIGFLVCIMNVFGCKVNKH